MVFNRLRLKQIGQIGSSLIRFEGCGAERTKCQRKKSRPKQRDAIKVTTLQTETNKT